MSIQNLVPVFESTINNDLIQTVNARELHTFLGSKQNFTRWMKDRITNYNFTENIDYIILQDSSKMIHESDGQNGQALESTTYEVPKFGQQGRIDYHISLDMAKEIAMVERNDKGKEARKYFIECEKQLLLNHNNNQTQLMIGSLTQSMLALTTEVNQIKSIVIEQQPKVAMYNQFMSSTNSMSIEEVAKSISNGKIVGRNRLFEYLRNKKVFNNNNYPYQKYINSKLFEVVIKTYTDSQNRIHSYSQVKATPRGVTAIVTSLKADCLL